MPEIAASEGLERVYTDIALVTRRGEHGLPTSSSSQPAIMAEMLERLALGPGLRVLEVGAGTGYNAALLSRLVGPGGRVTSMELDQDLAERAGRMLAAEGHPVRVVTGDALAALPDDGPYDRIILTASADHVRRLWADSLAEGGLLELPLRLGPGQGQHVVVTLRRVGCRLESVAVVPGGFMHLRVGAGDQPPDEPTPQVGIYEVVDGRRRSLATVSGPGIASMTPAARRRLAGVAGSAPRGRWVSVPGSADTTLLPYLLLTDPVFGIGLHYSRPDAWGAGVCGRDGRSLAVALGGRRVGLRLEAYGDGAAQRALDDRITRWRAAGRPSLDSCSIEVSFGARPRSPGGRILHRHGTWITIAWPDHPGDGVDA